MSSEPKWTKGPWIARQEYANRWRIDVQRDDRAPLTVAIVAAMVLEVGSNDAATGHNARLIAAAPALFDALLSVREFVQDELDNRDCAGGGATDYVNDAKLALEIIDGAIAKAMGEG